MKQLDRYHIILGSQSPRRRELLDGLGIRFQQRAMPDMDESYPPDMPRHLVPEFLARHKAGAYLDQLTERDLLITADTIVLLEGDILGKPHDLDEARRTLRRLSGQTHEVITGVAVCTLERMESFACTTRVHFAPIPEDDIEYYVQTYRPLDKAGAYGIQEWIGFRHIEGIDGSYYNVMGLPVHRLSALLDTF